MKEPDPSCGFCSGGSLLLTRAGHDPGCPCAQAWPVTGTKPPAVAARPTPDLDDVDLT